MTGHFLAGCVQLSIDFINCSFFHSDFNEFHGQNDSSSHSSVTFNDHIVWGDDGWIAYSPLGNAFYQSLHGVVVGISSARWIPGGGLKGCWSNCLDENWHLSHFKIFVAVS